MGFLVPMVGTAMSPATVAEGKDDDTIALILFVALVIQLARWKHTAETEKGLARMESAKHGSNRSPMWRISGVDWKSDSSGRRPK